ncbi:hypothetical protein QYF36_004169 [Acer negundo]|nr:hypothetical protein QYF36_004169 [Acer negundo]
MNRTIPINIEKGIIALDLESNGAIQGIHLDIMLERNIGLASECVESETFKEYVERFHNEVINLGAYDKENTLEDFIRNIRICRLWFNFQGF